MFPSPVLHPPKPWLVLFSPVTMALRRGSGQEVRDNQPGLTDIGHCAAEKQSWNVNTGLSEQCLIERRTMHEQKELETMIA